MTNQGYNLFLLMFNLSRIRDKIEIERIFCGAMEEMYSGKKFEIAEAKSEIAQLHMHIRGVNLELGYCNIFGDADKLSDANRSLIHNAVGILATILENREYENRLSHENLLLEQRVEESRNFIDNLASTAPIMIYIYDLEHGTFPYTNFDTWETTGIPINELGTTSKSQLLDRIPPEDIPKVYKHIYKLRTAQFGDVLEAEYRICSGGGNYKWYLCRDIPYRKNEKDKTVQFLGCAMNITEQKENEQHLQNSLLEKETLLKEVHHRVKNNMQVVSSLLNLQLARSQSEDVRNLLINSITRIRSMALVHEQLYGIGSFHKIDLCQYLRELISMIQDNYTNSNITLEVNTPDENTGNILYSIQDTVPIGLIINELVSNSIKYAFSIDNAGTIRIELKTTDDGNLIFEVWDNGKGLPEDIDFDNTTSLGLYLVRMLVAQLNGQVEYSYRDGAFYRIFLEPSNN